MVWLHWIKNLFLLQSVWLSFLPFCRTRQLFSFIGFNLTGIKMLLNKDTITIFTLAIGQQYVVHNYTLICFLNFRFFVRKEFQPTSVGTSSLFTYFAQHFTHQVFKSQEKIGLHDQRVLSMPSTYNNYHSLDLNNIYGDTEDILSRLRWIFVLCIHG